MIKKILINDASEAFCKKVNELSGETVSRCDQCGTCTGSCPMIIEMDITPSQMMRLVLLGDESVMETKTIWICASCYSCTARCPRGLDASKVAEALRQIKLRKAIDYMHMEDIDPKELKKFPQMVLVATYRKLTG
jgi:heterodisulfide reductase subunit C